MPSEVHTRVLIVDDINDTRESIKRMLQFDQSIEVIGTARTGREAVEQAQKLKPDVILMDINMPDMDGITATETIRRKIPYAQVIILSVQNDPDYMRRAMRVGAHDFLPKPPMIDELTSTIRRAGEVAIKERSKLEEANAIVAAGKTVTGALADKGKIIVVYSPKGGVGCTTIATNLALAMSAENKKVVIVDANMQFGDIPIFLSQQAKNNVLDLTPRVDELDPEVVNEVVIKSQYPELYMLAAPPRPELAEKVMGEQFGKLLQFLKGMYSCIIVDTASYLTDVVISALENADDIILVTTQDIPAIKNINAFLNLMDALGIPRGHISFIMNRFDKRIGITPERVSESLKQPVVLAIPLDEKLIVSDSIKRGVPIIVDNKSHFVSKSIFALAGYVKEKLTRQDEEALSS